MNILEDLWYGNYSPCDTFTGGNAEYKKALNDLTKREDLVNGETSGVIQKDVEELINAEHKLSCIAEMCAFSSGVRFGIRLMIEAVCS